MTFQTDKEQRLAATLARRQTPEFAKAGDRLLARKAAAKLAAIEQAAWDRLIDEVKEEVALYLVLVAFQDVRGENPEVECGWEQDVAENVLYGMPRFIRAEVLRMLGLEVRG